MSLRYTPPLRDMHFVLHEMFDAIDTLNALPRYASLDKDTFNAVLEEAGKFAAEVVLPTNAPGDAQGCQFDAASHSVKTPEGFQSAYRQYVEAGWPSLACEPEYGGQGLPFVLNQCVYEMLNSANQAWTMYPGLSHGAYEALLAHGSDTLKQRFLPPLTSGQWTGTMCLTEPHCGTDLGLLRTKAEPQADGSYLLTGNKIFISAGEHDLAENIVHLVLARLPDAPQGSKGISLFVVSKYLVGEDSQLGQRNRIFCTGIEHKMGIHGNATAQLQLDGAVGHLVGEPHKGLAAMFVMMNAARLGVGNQSLGLTEIAYQNALAYAQERLQMRSLSGPKAPEQPADPIIVHPDVRHQLLTAKAYAEGARMLGSYCGLLLDQAHHHPDEQQRAWANAQLALLTPVVKAFITDNGMAATIGCQQVFGGHGYIRETGMEQLVRDARINLIYEGTNAVQALDLLGRKVMGDQGRALTALGKQIAAWAAEHRSEAKLAQFLLPLHELGERLTELTQAIGARAQRNPDEIGAVAVDYLRIVGHMAFGWLWARAAQVALAAQARGETDPIYAAKLETARFYFARLMPEVETALRRAQNNAQSLMQTTHALA
ncbi:acyl-CoA dehydrogenase [Vandammella animalimorsus]|uniref:3-methylmercaptopropionyl-CoA dehydrogenase n=1 Tax=Vandammella animalimorsus TaxID=2029117 RepID=A0A3M6R4Y0_9BURK|nr:acyl-CoA dehydrogenase C-terminal domain-containing protein [Vandammella animalimorsus]RMX10247.1 acyl-CoA dehydrogenase [Vandammella animalimorsus]